ncbi:YmdB family metallophosphoesterase [Flavobacteriaceae bacterium]|nr:YmdB family metallophosphoesterase [Flavobacteriaceae bacterium]
MVKILFFGDIVGRSGRSAVVGSLKNIKEQHQANFTIINCDNASGGFGVNKNAHDEILAAGADVLTGGDHIWDQRDNNPAAQSKHLLRPLNYPDTTPGAGARIFEIGAQKILVIHLLGQVFLKENLNCPFAEVEKLLKIYKLGKNIDAIFIDFHAEATSEKMAMAKFLDGRVSAVIGTHTHIPTNDAHIMPNGTAYQTDAGMCGDYDSVIGMEKDVPIRSFLHKRKQGKMKPATKEATLCGCIIDIADNGLAKEIEVLKIGGILGDKKLQRQ